MNERPIPTIRLLHTVERPGVCDNPLNEQCMLTICSRMLQNVLVTLVSQSHTPAGTILCDNCTALISVQWKSNERSPTTFPFFFSLCSS